jgi:hypothetical protein
MSKTTGVALAFDCPNRSRAAGYDDYDKTIIKGETTLALLKQIFSNMGV